ncbi:glycoside hydrolase [Sphingomonas sp. Leaf25]|uniref:glycoside hydrolase n=1 Tax=Sphingomonas sp. Leaf25 TaxID=1735692 RepID=UPI0009EC13EF|nr:glycoside hydrolase [Sphingomonas sp. Leaf25]
MTGLKARLRWLLPLALILPGGVAAQDAYVAAGHGESVPVMLRIATDRPGTTFEGWGTALAWFANVTGAYPDATRERLADLFYGADGLGWTIARYNIGGGNAPDTPPYLRTGGAVPGFWRVPAGVDARSAWRADDPAMWDWSADAAQRWWLDAIRRRVDAPLFEAFSNSPPWFMTVSGRVSGATSGTDDNLRAGQEGAFAAYLARVVDELQRRHRIAFRTLSPVNEPNTDYWFAANTQEGAHWSPARQAAMIDASDAALKARGLTTVVAAPDETNSHLFLADWAAYPAATRARIGQLNVHSYGTVHQTGVRDIARASGIRLWMSEHDMALEKTPEQVDDVATALAFAEHVVGDLRRLEPAAWVFWQAVENRSARDGQPGSNWGIVKMDLTAAAPGPDAIRITRKYWAMANFSRHIRPGYRLVPVDDPDSVAALSGDGATLVIVHVNGGVLSRRLTLAPAAGGYRLTRRIVTDARRNAAADRITPVADPRSVTTFVLKRG